MFWCNMQFKNMFSSFTLTNPADSIEDVSEANKICIRRQEAVRKEVGDGYMFREVAWFLTKNMDIQLHRVY